MMDEHPDSKHWWNPWGAATSILVLLAIVIVGIWITYASIDTPPKRMQVCDRQEQKIVVIPFSDFDVTVYSKNLDDCR